MRRALFALLILAVGLLGGCGSEGDTTATSRGTAPETADPVPKLPPGWVKRTDPNNGVAFGLPPKWTAKAAPGASVLSSPDRRVTVTVTADRTTAALGTPVRKAAVAVAKSLSGRGFKSVGAGPPGTLKHFYKAASVRADAIADNGVAEHLQVVVLRKKGVVTISVLVARRASVADSVFGADVRRLIASIRAQPIG